MYLGGLNINNALQGVRVGADYSNFSNSIGQKLDSSSGMSNLGSNLGSGLGLSGMVGIGAQGLGATLGIANLGLAIHANLEQTKLAKESLKLARQQFMEENRRYEARENERINANNQIANTANSYQLADPMSRE